MENPSDDGQQKAYPKTPRMAVTVTHDGATVGEFTIVVGTQFADPVGQHQVDIIADEIRMAARKVQAAHNQQP